MRMAILDYGVGNIYSVKVALEKQGALIKVVDELVNLSEYDALILPGVGGFPSASRKTRGFKEEIVEFIEGGGFVLGICLGLQLMGEWSEEGEGEGLSIVKGYSKKLPKGVKIPHIGWNSVKIVKQDAVLEGLENNSYFYFVHSYYLSLIEGRDLILATTTYGVEFPSIIRFKNCIGTQFHPEKSGVKGRMFLKNFIKEVKR